MRVPASRCRLSVASARAPQPVALAPLDAVVALSAWTQSHGLAGVAAFGSLHVAAIVGCFPATILFEVAAGLLFGLWKGALLVWAVKATAASLTFALARRFGDALRGLGAARTVEAALAKQPRLVAMSDDVNRRGGRYALLARLSPVPSWANHYGLALVTDVKFGDFLGATMVATVPAILTHCSAGAAAASLLDIGSAPSSWLTTANGVVGAVGGGLLVQQLAAADATQGAMTGMWMETKSECECVDP